MEAFTKETTPYFSAANVVLKNSHDDSQKRKLGTVISDEETTIFQFVFFATICAVVSASGIVANTINIIIFYRQGFRITVNIAFFCLAISDLCCLISLGWASICMNPLLSMYALPWVDVDVMYLSAAWPHVCFCRITCYITVYITAERCLSIALPLKVKQIVTAKRTTFVIGMIYIVNFITLIPEYATCYLGWRFVPEKNATLVGIIFTSNRKTVEGVSFVVHSIISSVSFVGVIIFTIVLITKLKQSSQWRQEIMLNNAKQESMSHRDKNMVKMIVLIASILIACYIPGAIISMATFVVGSEFGVTGRYINICVATWSVACSCQSINSSINIFLYYKMSSKYRQTFDALLCVSVRFKKYDKKPL